jgi:glyoxylase-like metal-dependent hydrolase (beta-lactamase superfamily II)
MPFYAKKLENPTAHHIIEKVYGVTGLYHSAEEGFTVNAGILFTPDSIIFIDSGMTISSAEFLWETAQNRMKQQENMYLILTHHH